MSDTLYQNLAARIARSIGEGVLRPGERLPSIRRASSTHRLSVTTVKRAYQLLESQGVIEARPQSGYFVASASSATESSVPLSNVNGASGDLFALGMDAAPEPFDASTFVLSTLRRIQSKKALPLGSPYPDPAMFPLERLGRRMSIAARRMQRPKRREIVPPGDPDLIRQIALRHMRSGLNVDPAEIIITVGAAESINLCLRAVARPGDTIAVESPAFFFVRSAAERLGMRLVELDTHPRLGIDVASLANLVERQRIDAVVSMPNFQNPLGFVMPDESKRALVTLASERGLPLIENGTYNELYYGPLPPTTLKSYDTCGIVLHCSSFSKSLIPNAGVGWVLAGRCRHEVEQLKFLNTVSTSPWAQEAIAQFLAHDGWDRQLRRMRSELEQRGAMMLTLLRRVCPEGTRISEPTGGYLMWVELPSNVDALAVAREAMSRGLSIAPGHIFGNSKAYRSCMRLNYSYPWTAETEAAIKLLGKIISHMAAREPVGTADTAASEE